MGLALTDDVLIWVAMIVAAVVIENALLPYGRGRLEQAVGVGEPVIGDRNDLGAQAGVRLQKFLDEKP